MNEEEKIESGTNKFYIEPDVFITKNNAEIWEHVKKLKAAPLLSKEQREEQLKNFEKFWKSLCWYRNND